MIVGVGLDVVELERMERILGQSHGARFVQRVLTDLERVKWSGLPARRRLEYVAGRFAAKEAVVKALGCGIGAAVGFQDIEIVANFDGKPECRLSSSGWLRLEMRGDLHRLHVAITHERKLAAASAIVERLQQPSP